jgi:peptidoglycan/LPS O-acetylase OafA/YrhL
VRGADSGDRLVALDGLRGVAALVVVLSHLVEGSVPALSLAMTLGIAPSGTAGWFVRTPLAVLWAGPEFVIVFFVLSGFVLTRSLRCAPIRPWAYWLSRAVRLYMPAWLSLAVAGLLLLVPPAELSSGVQDWLATFTGPLNAGEIARQAALVFPPATEHHGTLNGVLWSLRWEVLFSLALPALLLVARAFRALSAPVLVACLACVGLSAGQSYLSFLPPFLVGLVLALREDDIARWRARLHGRGALLWTVGSLTLLGADLWLPGAVRAQGAGGMLVLVGASTLVLSPLLYVSVGRILAQRRIQWLGTRSFSLYLVHHPIGVAIIALLHGPGFGLLLLIALPTSLLAAEIFYRGIERPAHRLARRVGHDRRSVEVGLASAQPQPA